MSLYDLLASSKWRVVFLNATSWRIQFTVFLHQSLVTFICTLVMLDNTASYAHSAFFLPFTPYKWSRESCLGCGWVLAQSKRCMLFLPSQEHTERASLFHAFRTQNVPSSCQDVDKSNSSDFHHGKICISATHTLQSVHLAPRMR